MLGCLGQQGSGLLLRLVIGGLELEDRLLPFGGQLGSRFGGFALNRAPQVLGVKVGILAGGLCLVIGFAANRLGLPPSGCYQGVTFSLGLVDLSLNLLAQFGAQLVNLGRTAGLDGVTLARGVVSQSICLAARLLLDFLGLDRRVLDELASLLLS